MSVLQPIEIIECAGDKIHNHHLSILYAGIDRRASYTKRVLATLNKLLSDSKKRWVIDILHQNDCQRINAIMKSKTSKTFHKRVSAYVEFLATGTHYGALFNKDFIVAFNSLIGV